MFSESDAKELQFDTANLYRVEVFTDQKTGSIRRMIPVDSQGNPDPTRAVRYIGEASALTPAGALPLSFELAGNSLAEAARGFADGAQQALTETIEELKRLHREQQSSILVPGQGAGPLGGGFPPAGSSRLR